MWKKRLQILLWCLLGFGCVVLLVAAIQVKDGRICSGVLIDIDNHGEKIFINEKDIAEVLRVNNAVKGIAVDKVHLAFIEKELEKNAWIKDAQLFFDNNQSLTVNIKEKQPVARVFTTDGKSFYLDTAGNRLPLSDKISARVPVVTSYPSLRKKMTVEDSTIVQDVKNITQYIQQDSFWSAQVAQVDVAAGPTYDIVPVMGNQLIKLGNGENIDGKFKKLFAFYKQVWSKTGFEKYETIDLQFEGQVVAVRRGERLVPDSAGVLSVATSGGVAADSLHAAVVRPVTPARDSVATNRTVVNAPHSNTVRGRAVRPRGSGKPVKPGGKGKKRTATPVRH